MLSAGGVKDKAGILGAMECLSWARTGRMQADRKQRETKEEVFMAKPQTVTVAGFFDGRGAAVWKRDLLFFGRLSLFLKDC